MRILVATSNRSVVGGIETYLRELLPVLQGRGHDLALLFNHSVETGQGTVDNACAAPVWGADDIRPAELRRRIADWGPDVIYSQGLTDPDLEQILFESAPTVLFAHGYYGTCVSGTKRHTWPSTQCCERKRGVTCLWHYLPRGCGGQNPITMLRHYWLQARRGAFLKHFRAVLVASRHMEQEYLRHGVSAERLHLCPLFPPGEVPDPQAPPRREPTGRVLLVGRLTDLKGGTFLVKAIHKAATELGSDFMLVVAGDGPERARLEILCRRLGVKAEFHGWVDADKRRALMRGADVLAVPSVWPEPFGLVGLEAACVGLPAVGFAVGGIPDWLRPGESGELAPGERPGVADLAAALIRALADPDRLNHLRHGAWRMAFCFSREKHVLGLEAIFRAVASTRTQDHYETTVE
jgi:glycosyltransferase involved in cell wall biosynthesis